MRRLLSPPLKGEAVRVSEPEGLFLRLNTPQPLRGSPPYRGANAPLAFASPERGAEITFHAVHVSAGATGRKRLPCRK